MEITILLLFFHKSPPETPLKNMKAKIGEKIG